MAKSKAKSGLGRGLGALLLDYDEIVETPENKDGVMELELEKIVPNPEQPRKSFDEDKLMDLAESIREHGVLQPILVAPRGEYYMIIAGERRFRASQQAGLKTIPVIIRDLGEEEVMELALIENVQRDNLTPIEEAHAYDILQRRFGYTQERLAKRMGKSRSAIANATRLLALPEDVQEMVEEGKLTVGHVRPMLTFNDAEWQSAFAHEVYQDNLTVREVEKIVKDAVKRGKIEYEVQTVLFEAPAPPVKSADELRSLQEQLAERLSTKVTIKSSGRGGKLIIEYYNDDDLKRIFDGISGEFY